MDILKHIKLEPGHYIVAVSGGVDSMALMHMLAGKQVKGSKVQGAAGTTKPSTPQPKPLSFTVAHFDHGIRDDSHIDRQLVAETARRLGLPFVFGEGKLGPLASEDEARRARYEFLKKVQNHANARAIVTAHHHDDVVETAVLNLMRGTGRKGLTSLRSRDGLVRPLLHVPKHTLKSYAEANGLVWHEDSTNMNQAYRRNYVRQTILKKAKARSPQEYRRLLMLLRRQRELNHAIDGLLETVLHVQPKRTALRRRDVVSLPYNVAAELVAEWLRRNGKRGFNRWLVDKLTVAIRTSRPHTELLLDSRCKVSFGKTDVVFVSLEASG